MQLQSTTADTMIMNELNAYQIHLKLNNEAALPQLELKLQSCLLFFCCAFTHSG